MRSNYFTFILSAFFILNITCNKEDDSISANYGSVRGIVYDNNSDIVYNAKITTEPETKTVYSNDAGEYEIRDITPGTYIITADKIGYIPNGIMVSISPKQTSAANIMLVKSEITNYGAISGSVSDTAGNPINMAQIKLDPSNIVAYTDNSGQYQIVNVTPGQYTITAYKANYETITQESFVFADSVTLVNFTLKLKYSGPQVIKLNTKQNTHVTYSRLINYIIDNLVPGAKYSISVSSKNISGTKMKGVYFIYEEANGITSFRFINVGEGFTFFPTDKNKQIVPFLTDWSDIYLNKGKMIVIIDGPTKDSIHLDTRYDVNFTLVQVAKIVSGLTPGYEYTVTISSDSIKNTCIDGAFLSYKNADGTDTYRYGKVGDVFTFKPSNDLYQFAAFLVDWDFIDDNEGDIIITIE